MRKATVFLALAVVLIVPHAFAQTTATITGAVSDATGAVIPGVEVTVTNTATGQARKVLTNELGRYLVPALNPGSYTAAASLCGFETVLRSGITLTVGNEVVINFTLTPGQINQKVEIIEDAPVVQTTNAAVAEVVG